MYIRMDANNMPLVGLGCTRCVRFLSWARAVHLWYKILYEKFGPVPMPMPSSHLPPLLEVLGMFCRGCGGRLPLPQYSVQLQQ